MRGLKNSSDANITYKKHGECDERTCKDESFCLNARQTFCPFETVKHLRCLDPWKSISHTHVMCSGRLTTRKFNEKWPETFQTAAVYQLQRRVRTLREQLQRRDLHLDLLRRKLTLQEDNCRIRSLLEGERDEANLR